MKSKWKKRQCLRKKKIHDENGQPRISTFIEREFNKPELNDFTLTEYTEKVIMYGYVMVSSDFNTFSNNAVGSSSTCCQPAVGYLLHANVTIEIR